MNLLAFETSTRRLSVALLCEGKITERAAVLPHGGSEQLLPWVEELLVEAGRELSDLDGIALGIGPGTFTGLRLAAGCAQGLAYGLDIPIIRVCTLEAVALESGESRVIACLDARMNEVYSAAYDGGREVLPPSVTSSEHIPWPPGNEWVKCDNVLPTAKAIAKLATPRLQRGEGETAALAIPVYVRDNVAKTTAERLAEGGMR